MYKQRTLSSFFKKADQQFPVLLITGPRQVGKTTFLQHQKEDARQYVSLDDPLVRDLAKSDPALFLQRFPPPVLIDEIQYAPELLPLIKLRVDQDRRPGQFWLTGSQQFHLMQGVSESLAGRIGILHLQGFSRREQSGLPDSPPFLPRNYPDTKMPPLALKALYEEIWRGSFPDLTEHPEKDRDLFYNSYVQTYIQRDVRDLTQVGDEMAFLRFLRAAAARTGKLLNLAEMAQDTGVAPNTAKNWLSILKTSGLVHLLEPWHGNVTKRLIKSPKLYFLDTGLAAFLTEWSSPETLEAGAMSGAILETWVLSEILKSYWHNGKTAPLYYYRDKDKKEIDLLIVQDGTLYPLEIKKNSSPGRAAVSGFGVLNRLGMPIGPGGVFCLAETRLPLTETLELIPVGSL